MTREELFQRGLSPEQADFVLDAWERQAREQALQTALDAYDFSSAAARNAAAETARQAGLPMENGGFPGLSALMDKMRQNDPGAFAAPREPVRFTAPTAPRATATVEQIMQIPDRALRRAAIAENMNLFKGDQ